MVAQQLETQTIPSLPNELTAASTKLVYLYVAAVDGATIDQMEADLDMRKLSLFPVVEDLADRNLLQTDGNQYQLDA